jgi:predicted DNA-binding transcriptional regulator AlpA
MRSSTVTPTVSQAFTPTERSQLQKLREILTERELSDWLGISQPTLSRLRRDKTGPAYVRLSARRVGYRRSAVEDWLKRREQQTINPGCAQ